MHKKARRIFIVAGIMLFLFSRTPGNVFAVDLSEGIAIDIEIKDKSVPDGSIISLSDGRYRMSNIPYDSTAFGVVTYHPSVAFRDLAREDKYSVVTVGKTLVRVSTINGPIKSGDLITTSTIPGVAQLAKENGYVIGIAHEDYTEKDPQKIGAIYTTLHLNYGLISYSLRENLLAALRTGSRAPFSSPLNMLRYTMAIIIALLSFAAGFLFFGKVSSRGVEAIARNPLARKSILLSVLLNVFMTVAVMGLGVALAYLILVI